MLIALWFAIFAAPLFMFQDDDVFEWNKILMSWKSVLPFFVLFLINHFILVPLFLFKNRKARYFISVIVVVSVFPVLLSALEQDRRNIRNPQEQIQTPPPHNRQQINPPERMFPPPPGRKANPFPYPPIINSMLLSILIVGFDAGLRMTVRWSKLEQEKTLLEKENVQNQLSFLRNQVSPHFFMNTLNNIHSLIDVNSEEAKEAIIKLSKLMRYLLYDSEVEKVPVAKELEFISSYIKLMKLRFSEKVQIHLSIPEKIPAKLIPPLLFTSFVENAFKHGISYQNISYIEISFVFEAEQLIFEIKNSIPENKKDDSGFGIGIENSRKRLDIVFGDQYWLDIINDPKEYKITLKIPV